MIEKNYKWIELKLFLTFFLVYLLFIHWSGYNENSRFGLTRSIVEHASFDIDDYYNLTTDRSYFEGKYYSDKEPGMSFLATVPYFLWNNFYVGTSSEKITNFNNSGMNYLSKKINNEVVFEPININLFVFVSMIFSVLISVTSGSLSVVVLYKVLKYFTNNNLHNIIVCFIYALGTLIFPSSLVFLDQATVTFFALMTFLLILKANEKSPNIYYFLAGIFSGFNVVIGMTGVILASLFSIYLLLTKRNVAKLFIFGFSIGILPFFVYDFSIFHNPFIIPRAYLDKKLWDIPGYHGLLLPNIYVIFRLLFYPYRGLFFYYPIIIFSSLGIFYLYKKHKLETLLIISIFLSFLIFNSMWWFWHGGSSFGPKILTPSIPFLMIPLTQVIGNKKLKLLFAIFVLFSVFNNLTSLSAPLEDILGEKSAIDISVEYKNKISSFEIMENILFKYYYKNFFESGPKSKLIENIFSSKNQISLTREAVNNKNIVLNIFKNYLLSININFFILVSLFSFIFILWNKELRSIT